MAKRSTRTYTCRASTNITPAVAKRIKGASERYQMSEALILRNIIDRGLDAELNHLSRQHREQHRSKTNGEELNP